LDRTGIAVTGANGHIGANLCRELTRRGFPVKALVHKNTRGIDSLPLHRVTGDVMDSGSLRVLLEDVDVVFHLAAVVSIKREKKEVLEKNFEGTLNVLQAAVNAGVRKLVHFSSIHALDPEPSDRIMDERRSLALNGRSPYCRSKAMAEKAVLDAAGKGLDAVILNPTAVIGPYDFAPSLSGRALILMYGGKLPAIVRGGYDWVDVRDVVGAAIASAGKGRRGERYILSGRWRSLPELCTLISRLNRKKHPFVTCSVGTAKIGLPFLKLCSLLMNTEPLYTLDSMRILKKGNRKVSHAKASAELGFRPRPLEETLEDTLTWYAENGYLD